MSSLAFRCIECRDHACLSRPLFPLFLDEEGDVPQEYLIPKYELAELCSETAKLKSLGAMSLVPPERLVRLLNILEKNIRDGAKVTPIVDEVMGTSFSLWKDGVGGKGSSKWSLSVIRGGVRQGKKGGGVQFSLELFEFVGQYDLRGWG